jgi:acetyl esterase/lipase
MASGDRGRSLLRDEDRENMYVAPGAHPPIDPEINAVLQLMRPEYRGESWIADKIGLLRELWSEAAPPEEDLRAHAELDVVKVEIPGVLSGEHVSAMIIRPRGAVGRLPCIYHVHGGGMIAGDWRTGYDYMMPWVRSLGIVVVSVEYRIAPEHSFPAAIEDCYQGLVWTAAHADELDIRPDQLLIAGASAGGGLAAATALMARDRGGPTLQHQLLLCPMLDDRELTPSSQYEGIPWDRTSNRTGWTALLGVARGTDLVSPYAAPSRATDLSGLPPAFLEVGGVEVFRDETLDFGTRLAAAGVPIEIHVWAGATHGFDAYAPQAEVSRAARDARISYLKRALAL